MITKIELTNFQRHKKLTLDLKSGVASIIGPTNAGKSTIIRALRWVLLNVSPKRGVVHHDATVAKVTIEIDGRTLTRKRGKENLYYLDGERFVAFGTSVPKPIQEFLKVNETNFQKQLAEVFWFQLPAPQMSRELNKIVNLASIDSSMALVATKLRRALTVKEVCDERLLEARKGLGKYDLLNDADEALSVLEGIQQEIDGNRLQKATVGALLEDGSTLVLAAEKTGNAVWGGEIALESARELQNLQNQRRSLESLLGEGFEALDTIETLADDPTEALEGLRVSWDSIMALREDICQLLEYLNGMKAWLDTDRELKAAEQQLSKYERCPTCGSLKE